MSACGVEQSANRFLFRELVIELHGVGRGQDMHCDLPFFQEIQSLGRNLKTFVHSPGENNNSGTVIEQFLDVSRLNARNMIGTRVPPVPFSRAAGKNLRVLIGLGFSLDIEPSPGNVFDSRRPAVVFHIINIVRGQPLG